MPSPFPGMDPFLEDPSVFSDFHNGMIFCLQAELKSKLRRPYFAATGRRTWIEVSERYVGPDINLHRDAGRPSASHGAAGTATADSSVATADMASAIVVHVPHDEREESFLEIFIDDGGRRRLVTSLELLSPSNKTNGEHGRDLYLRKQKEMLESRVHFVEIDLLRGGLHTTAVPGNKFRALAAPPSPYHVCVHRFDRWQDFLVYPIALTQPLPRIPIPLLPEDGDVVLDLQSAFNRAYDAGPYDVEINYEGAVPAPPLSPENQAWMRSLPGMGDR